jgi:hypothetical protein
MPVRRPSILRDVSYANRKQPPASIEADVLLLADDAAMFRRASSPARMTSAPRMRANVSAHLRHMGAVAPTGVLSAEEVEERHQQLLERHLEQFAPVALRASPGKRSAVQAAKAYECSESDPSSFSEDGFCGCSG